MVAGIIELLRSRSGALIAALAFSTVATGVLLISIPLELRQLNATPGEAGIALGMFGFGMLAFEWLWGVLADRFGYRAPMIASQLLYAVFIAILSQVATVPLIAACYFLASGAMVAGGPIPRSYVGMSARPDLRATGLALVAAQWVFAEAIGAGVGGALIDRFSIRPVILASAILPLVSAALVAIVLRAGDGRAPEERAGDRRTAPSREARSRVLFVLVITAALALLIQVGLGGELALLPLLITVHLSLSPSAAGLAMLAVGAIGGLLLVPGGRVADVWGRRQAMAAGAVITAAGYVAYAVAENFGLVLGGAVVRAVGSSLIWPAVTAWVSESVPRRRHAFYMGLFGEFENVGVTLGPVAGGIAWAAWGLPSAFYVFAAAAAVAALVAAVGVRPAPVGRQPHPEALAQDFSRR